MKYRPIRWIVPLGLFAICIVAQQQTFAHPNAQEQDFLVYLPLMTGASTVTAPPPPEQPVRNGLFALDSWLTYNATTAVDAGGGVHFAFSVSDEKHKDDPSGAPAIYVYCPGPVSTCSDGSNWSELV